MFINPICITKDHQNPSYLAIKAPLKQLHDSVSYMEQLLWNIPTRNEVLKNIENELYNFFEFVNNWIDVEFSEDFEPPTSARCIACHIQHAKKVIAEYAAYDESVTSLIFRFFDNICMNLPYIYGAKCLTMGIDFNDQSQECCNPDDPCWIWKEWLTENTKGVEEAKNLGKKRNAKTAKK